jgi:cardiolipin synthase
MDEHPLRITRTNGMNPWRAGCVETRTSGSEGGPRKRTGRNPGTAPRSDPYTRQFADALMVRARAGVRVRVLLDSFGSRLMDGDLVERLRAAGAQVERFRPYPSWKLWRFNLRTHRRVLVCDDEVAFTGGAGIAEEWTGDARSADEWRDTHFRVRGPAVDGVHAAFYSDWLETPGPVLGDHDRFPSRAREGGMAVQAIRGSSQPGWNDIALSLRMLIDLARERIRITSAYFRPPRHFLDLLCHAARRGVRVQVMVPGPHAEPKISRWISESMYDQLLGGGIELWRYQPAMHHGKVVTVDGIVSLVGTANFDSRSVALNEQVGLIVHDEGFTGILDRHFDEDVEHSRLIGRDEWARRGSLQRATERMTSLPTHGFRGGAAGRR